MLISEIISAIESYAPLRLQESYDNCGLLVGNPSEECSGVVLCVDVNSERVAEAVALGCNLIVSHHPLIFRGLKSLTGATEVERTVAASIKSGVAIYACHTSLDNAPGGVSAEMARMLGLADCRVLVAHPSANGSDSPAAGLGIIGRLREPMTPYALAQLTKTTFGSPIARCSSYPADSLITTVALCSGSGASFIGDARKAGAQAYITSDTKYHDFADCANEIFIIDIGHYESEKCTTAIFKRVISEKFPNFAVHISQTESNPINYI